MMTCPPHTKAAVDYSQKSRDFTQMQRILFASGNFSVNEASQMTSLDLAVNQSRPVPWAVYGISGVSLSTTRHLTAELGIRTHGKLNHICSGGYDSPSYLLVGSVVHVSPVHPVPLQAMPVHSSDS